MTIKNNDAINDKFHLSLNISFKPLSETLINKQININIADIANADGSKKILNLKLNELNLLILNLLKFIYIEDVLSAYYK